MRRWLKAWYLRNFHTCGPLPSLTPGVYRTFPCPVCGVMWEDYPFSPTVTNDDPRLTISVLDGVMRRRVVDQ